MNNYRLYRDLCLSHTSETASYSTGSVPTTLWDPAQSRDFQNDTKCGHTNIIRFSYNTLRHLMKLILILMISNEDDAKFIIIERHMVVVKIDKALLTLYCQSKIKADE